MTSIRGILFDKDGTLFDFQATWGSWGGSFITEMARGDQGIARTLSETLGYDTGLGQFRADSPAISGTMEVILDAVMAVRPDWERSALSRFVSQSTGAAPQVEVTPLVPFLSQFSAAGIQLGVATNDSEAPTRVQLARSGIEEHFAFIAGYDSGFGGKPQPGMLLAFCEATGLNPAEVAMIGDSAHDLHAARAAGMYRVGVLTGPASHADLLPHADIVLPSIVNIPDWLKLTNATPDLSHTAMI